MPFPLSIPFQIFQLRFQSGATLYIPLKDKNVVRINDRLAVLAGKYAELFQQKILNRGNYEELLNERHEGNIYKGIIHVPIKAHKDKISYPNFEIAFDYYFYQTERGYRAFVPSLAIECFHKEESKLLDTIEETIRLEFTRNKRLNMMQSLVSTMWMEATELRQTDIDFLFHTPYELENILETEKEQLLPKIGTALQLDRSASFGRETKIQQLASAMKGKFNRNVLLVGKSGVGKTALIQEIAFRQKALKIDSTIWETTAAVLIKELTKDTGWQDNMVYLCRELTKRQDFLFIRNLMELFEVGQYQGNSVSMAEYLLSYISRGEVNILTECTDEELAQIELRSPNFVTNFQVIRLEEPKNDLEQIILSKVNQLAKTKKIAIEAEAVRETLRLNRRFTPYSGFPGKPIQFLQNILSNYGEKEASSTIKIDRQHIINHFCEETGIPNFVVDPNIPMDLAKIKKDFKQQLFGQDKAVDALVQLLAAVKTAMTRTGKPIASFLFVGPTGVGKTELAKILAHFMFGSRDRMVRFDMSEYSDPYAVMRLIGDGRTEGRLTAAIRREPFSVLLFDEIEKASPNFYDLLLQLLSEGRLTDDKGKLVNFCSSIIIMTSNIGASKMQQNPMGLHRNNSNETIETHFLTAAQKHFRPELFNRIDKIIPFHPLDLKSIRHVVDREITLFRKREGVKFRKMDLQIDDECLAYLGKKGFDPKYGARYLQRAIREELVIPLAHALNTEDIDDQLIVKANLQDEVIVIEVTADPMGFDLLLEELDKLNLADLASEYRRRLNTFKSGHFYVHILSDIDVLEKDKEREKAKFWKKEDKVALYTAALQTKKDVDELAEQIESLEMNLSLSCLDLNTYLPDWSKELEIWTANFDLAKQAFYARRNIEGNTCVFALYGNDINFFLKQYLSIIKETDWKISGQQLWFDPVHYNETEERVVEQGGEKQTIKRYRKEYKKTNFNPFQDYSLSPNAQGHKCYGVELEIKGEGVSLYLADEVGLHRLEDLENPIVCSVELFGKEYKTPSEIHRKEYFSNKTIRRKIEASNTQDSHYKTNFEVEPHQLAPALKEFLDQRFKEAIDAVVMG